MKSLMIVMIASTTFAAAQDAKMPPSKVVVWKLGSQLNLAMVLSHRSSDPKVTESVYGKAKTIAQLAGVEIPALPGKMELPGLLGVMSKANQSISEQLAKKYDRDHAKLFDLAGMSMTVLLVYEFGDQALNKKFVDGITERAKEAGLPEALWQPVTRVITSKGSFADLRAAVLKMDNAISSHLNTEKK